MIGTTGLSEPQQNELHKIAINQDVAVFICPNFSIGAILMMEFAKKKDLKKKLFEINLNIHESNEN